MSELIQQIRDTIGIDDPIKRIAAAGFLSVFTTFGILWVMQILIATGEGAITSKYEGRFVDFVRIKKDESLSQEDREQKLRRLEMQMIQVIFLRLMVSHNQHLHLLKVILIILIYQIVLYTMKIQHKTIN